MKKFYFLTFFRFLFGLTDSEISKFRCREGNFYQFGRGSTDDSVEYYEYATSDNGYTGCHTDRNLPCYKTEYACSMETSEVTNNGNGVTRVQFDFNGVPDHNAWGLTPSGTVVGTDKSYRLPKNPTLLTEAEGIEQGAPAGLVGFGINGVSIFTPYNSDCCDAIWDELASMDYCMGHPANGNYHYHFFAYGNQYDKCLMSCDQDTASDIVGIALDGFPIYGPMQYYSSAENKIYIDPSSCSDCSLTLVNTQRDACGGIEVADGNAADGTNYRYITSNLFPYILQCWRGDMSLSQKSNNGNYRKVNWNNKCGTYSTGDETDGGTWSDTEHTYTGGSCDIFDQHWVEANNCTEGNCPYSYQDFQRSGEIWARSTTFQLDITNQ